MGVFCFKLACHKSDVTVSCVKLSDNILKLKCKTFTLVLTSKTSQLVYKLSKWFGTGFKILHVCLFLY